MGWPEATARWYAVLVLLTWGWAPLVRALCPRLPDRGALLARPLALLGVVYPTWLLAGLDLLPYSTAGLWVTLVAGTVVAWGYAWRRGAVDRGWLRSMAVADAIFFVAFAAYVWLRGFTPEILNTEKPMDAAFLSSAARTVTIPPPDPWFAGEPINYYYLGYLLHGAVARMADVPSTTAFNLALATTFAMTVTAAAGVGFDAARPWFSRGRALVAAGSAATLIALLGNVYAALRFFLAPAETIAAGWWDKAAGVGWRASRVVCDGPRVNNDCPSLDGRIVETINEFPFFSFLLGDLHPHVMALPFTLVALALALDAILRRRGAEADAKGATDAAAWVRLGFAGAAVGSLYAMNSWDMPTFLLLLALGVWLGFGGKRDRRALAAVAVVLASALLAWAPFVVTFVPPPGENPAGLPAGLRGLPLVPTLLSAVGLHLGERTSVGEFLTVFGIPYLFVLWLIGQGLLRRNRESAGTRPGPVAIVAVPLVLFALLLPAPTLVLAGLPLVGAVLHLRRGPGLSPRSLATGLSALGLGLLVVVEVFYIRDAFDSRMNTLFKVYYQVWTLFAVAAALALVALWREARPRRLARPVLLGALAVGLAAGTVYPAVASYRWTDGFEEWTGLDGIAYVAEDQPDEAAAIRWLQANARPDDVLLEAAGCAYQPISRVPFNRVSAFTGVPTVLGWGGHERQWRAGQPELIDAIPERERDVARAFADPDGDAIERYGVTLLYVGRYERDDAGSVCEVAGAYPAVRAAGYPGPGWETAFESGEVRVYRRSATAAEPPQAVDTTDGAIDTDFARWLYSGGCGPTGCGAVGSARRLGR